VKSIGSYHNSIGPYCEIYRLYHNSIGSYHLFVIFWTIAIGNLHFDCPRNPTTSKYADHHLGKACTGSYHRPTSHRDALWNRPRTDVVGPYRIAVACCIHLALYMMNYIGSVRIVVGSVLNSLGRTLNSIGSYLKSTGSYSEFFRFMS
jgi:hypothetical protein